MSSTPRPGIKGFLMKPVATGYFAEMVRKVLDEAKGSTHAYVIPFLSIGRSGNINNPERMQKTVVPKN
jgi:hypothetical protein